MPDGPADASRILIVRLRYDGSGFAGFAKQPGLRTVEGVLEEALTTVLRPREPLAISVAGRTDAQVHALGQVASVSTSSSVDVGKLERSLRKLLPPDISATVEEGPDDFDARRSAVSRRYRYKLLTSPLPDPLRRARTWWVGPLRAGAESILQNAAALVRGTHDFGVFCKDRKTLGGTRRTVKTAYWSRPDCSGDCCAEELWFEIEANAFCREMVRRIVGAMVAWASSGEDPVSPEAVDRYRWKPAPPEGLYLLGVRYPLSFD